MIFSSCSAAAVMIERNLLRQLLLVHQGKCPPGLSFIVSSYKKLLLTEEAINDVIRRQEFLIKNTIIFSTLPSKQKL